MLQAPQDHFVVVTQRSTYTRAVLGGICWGGGNRTEGVGGYRDKAFSEVLREVRRTQPSATLATRPVKSASAAGRRDDKNGEK